MKLIAPTSHLAEKFGLAGAVDILAGAGFDGADFSAYRSEEFYTDVHPDSYYTELRVRAVDGALAVRFTVIDEKGNHANTNAIFMDTL